jgi:hypothetical protein
VKTTVASGKCEKKNDTEHSQWAIWQPRDPPIIDFYVRTWRGDGHWLIYLLRSIEIYVPRTLYRQIIITFPSTETPYFHSYLPLFSLPLKLIPVDDIFISYGNNNGGYYSQMFDKFHAFERSDADFFIHMDSDTVFKAPVTRRDFLDDHNRVYVKRDPFVNMTDAFRVWRKAAEGLLLEPVPYETMTGFPFVFPRDLYPKTIDLIEKRHKKCLLHVFQSRRNLIEFTTLGHFLITHMPPTRWIENVRKSEKVAQSWSWGGFGPNEVAWYECLLRAKNESLCQRQSPKTS